MLKHYIFHLIHKTLRQPAFVFLYPKYSLPPPETCQQTYALNNNP